MTAKQEKTTSTFQEESQNIKPEDPTASHQGFKKDCIGTQCLSQAINPKF